MCILLEGKRYKAFALSKGIIPFTFQKYAHNDASKRRKIGVMVVKPSVVSAYNDKSVVQQTIRADRSNKGLTAANVSRVLLQMQPVLKPIQARK